jgi:adenine-specific DNA-methyltransferase
LPPGFPADFDEGVIEPKVDFWPKMSCPVVVRSGVTQNSVVLSSGWSSKELAEKFISGNFQPIVDSKGQSSRFYLSKTGALYVRKVRSDSQSHVLTVLKGMGTVQEASSELAEMGIFFSYPKPVSLIEYLVRVGTSDCDIILDLFAGSGTLGEAIFRLNSKAGKRRFVLVQLPEELDIVGEKGGVSQKTVAEIGKERLRKSGAKIRSATALTAPNLDTGFRVLKIDISNMRDVYYAPDAVEQRSLLAQVDNIRPDRTTEDLLFHVLVDQGVDLALPIAEETIAGKKVFFVDGNALAACFDDGITDELVKEIAKRQPLKAVFRDANYGSDSVKINVDQIFRLLSPETEVRSL